MYRALRIVRRDQTLFDTATRLAFLSDHSRVRVGAVLTKGGTTLAQSFNRMRNPIENVEYGDATYHAEHRVLASATKFNCTLYVARVGLRKSLLASFPCDRCVEEIVGGGRVSKLVYYDGQTLVKVRVL